MIRVFEIEEEDQRSEWLDVRNELEPDEPLLGIGSAGPKGSPPELAYGQSVAARPEHGVGAYDVAARTWRDIPGETGVQEREAWLSLHVEGAPDGALVALHEGRVVGFAGLHELAGEGVYEHGLIAVLPPYRRRGIARAMKTEQLKWLKARGARRVVTWNSEANHAARVLNLSLVTDPCSLRSRSTGPSSARASG